MDPYPVPHCTYKEPESHAAFEDTSPKHVRLGTSADWHQPSAPLPRGLTSSGGAPKQA